MEKRYVTLFYKGLYNGYLVKDIGQIPYLLHKHHGYEATLVGSRSEESFPLLESETKGLKLEFIKHGRPQWKLFRWPVLRYLVNNAKSIDVLSLFQCKGESLVYGILYKILNPKGILYIKLDSDLDVVRKARSCLIPTLNIIRKPLFKLLLPIFFRKVDFFTIEQKEGLALVQEYHRKFAHKFFYLPNGVSERFFEDSKKHRSYAEKENIILTVGRIGTRVKHNEMLLEAISKINLGEWSVALVGPTAEGFDTYIEEYFRQYPHLKEKVHFTGPLFEREQLLEWFDRSKVFCFTSSGESFGIVLVEAMLYNNYVVTTDISSATDITANGTLGSKMPRFDVERLAEELERLIGNEQLIEEKFGKVREYAMETFRWEPYIHWLHEKIISCEKKPL